MRNSSFLRLPAIALLSALLAFAVAPASLAESEDIPDGLAEAAAEYLVLWGVMQGDENGNLNLDKGMTRAELAVFLTRLDAISYSTTIGGLSQWEEALREYFAVPEKRVSAFVDLPAWALPYIEYCYDDLMQGVSADRFDPQASVSPKMACATLLRYGLNTKGGDGFDGWDYDDSIETARDMGWLPENGLGGATITRGEMAILTERGFAYRATTVDCSVPPTMSLEEMRNGVLQRVNAARENEGLPELKMLPELNESAQLKAQDLLDNNYFAHESPTYGSPAEMVWSLVPRTRGFGVGENIALGQSTPQTVMSAWMGSTGHRANILHEAYAYIGIGAVHGPNGGTRWVQQFAVGPV